MKSYDYIVSLIMGIILVVLAIILYIVGTGVYMGVVELIIFIFFIRLIFDIGNLLIRWKSIKKIGNRKKMVLLIFFHLVTCITFVIMPNLFYSLVPVLFSIYLSLIGLSQFVGCFIEISNGEFVSIFKFLLGVICLVIAIPILFNPIMTLDRFCKLLATYMLLLSSYYWYDFVMLVMSVRAKNNLKRRIRITLPKIVEAIIPYSVMVEINRNLEIKKPVSYSFLKTDECQDLHIFIHTSSRGVNRMGHIDIYFDNKVISYGNYDEGSRYFKQFFGDGVLFTADNWVDYINFCIDNSGKTIFDFGISLTDIQKNRIRKRIEELFSNIVPWNYKTDKGYDNGNSYASKLYKKTKAKFYKFKKGKYCTYYVLGTNCCYLVDDILGRSGMDILSINGIITPGTYYDYLNKEFRLKGSNVISKDVYNFDNRPNKDI